MEELRDKLNKSIIENGIASIMTLEISRKLDIEIVKEQKGESYGDI